MDVQNVQGEPCLRVGMPFEVDQHSNLQQAVDLHLEQREMAICHICQKRLTKTTTITIQDPKQVLVVYLNRIVDNPKSNTPEWATMSKEEKAKFPHLKDNRFLQINNILRVPQEDGIYTQFELISTIEHVGDDPSRGHYVSFLRDVDKDQWWVANDRNPLRKASFYNDFDIRRSTVFLYRKTE